MSEQLTPQVNHLDQEQDYLVRSEAAAQDAKKGNSNAEIQVGVIHGPHLPDVKADFPGAEKRLADSRNISEGVRSAHVSEGAAKQLKKQLITDTQSERWSEEGIIPKGETRAPGIGTTAEMRASIIEDAEHNGSRSSNRAVSPVSNNTTRPIHAATIF
jgi:hypothetical protein